MRHEFKRTEYHGEPRFPHSINLDGRNRNRYRPTYRPSWTAIGLGLGAWCLIGQVIRVVIR